MFRIIDKAISVSPQITLDQVAEAKALGFTTIVNNRPDDEEEGQLNSNTVEAAVETMSMTYVAIPITHAGFSGAQVDAMVAALVNADGPVLAYCRSGTRSTLLWALARAKMGDAPEEIALKAHAAGYDVGPVRALIDALAAG